MKDCSTGCLATPSVAVKAAAAAHLSVVFSAASTSNAMSTNAIYVAFILLLSSSSGWCQRTPLPMRSRYGEPIGELSNKAHGITGSVYAVSDTVLFIKQFTYDGMGPDAFFWTGNSSHPSPTGIIIPYPAPKEKSHSPLDRNPTTTAPPDTVLGPYSGEDVLLRMPHGVKVTDLRWLSVWCRRFTVDFGSVIFPENLNPPLPQKLPELKRLGHGLRSSDITMLDMKTFYISDLHYDGAAPDAYFWVGTGPEPNAQGVKVPNELNELGVLRGYQGEDIEIQLPGNMTMRDIDWLSVWCISFRENFGHVMIPKDLDLPPALGQNQLTVTTKAPSPGTNPAHEFDSCIELLDGRMQVQWESILDGVIFRLSARMDDNDYMAFGISGVDGRTRMIGGDVTVAYFNSDDSQFHADDYHLSSKSQCDGTSGACPDERIGGRNDASALDGQRVDGVTTVVYQRTLEVQPGFDQRIPLVGRVNVIAAIGPLNSRKEANYHSHRTGPTEDHRIDLSSRGVNQCPVLLAPPAKAAGNHDDRVEEEALVVTTTENPNQPWKAAIISGETNFTARIGPTGGKRGYSAITGHVSWGISWYINDLLIPEIYVERGETYTFLVQGGNDPTNSPRYHPFYITDNAEGGFGQKTEDQQREQKVYAGVEFDNDGFPYPTAAGSLCEWKHKGLDKWNESATFEEFKETLFLDCQVPNQVVALTWTVPQDAPSILYYQCYTHNSLGWKIRVVDPGFQPPGSGAVTRFQALGISTLLFIISVFHLLLS